MKQVSTDTLFQSGLQQAAGSHFLSNNTVQMHNRKLPYRSPNLQIHIVSVNIPAGFFVETEELIQEFVWNLKRSKESENHLEKRSTVIRMIHLISKLTARQ